MKFRDPERLVKKYQREGLPRGKRIDPHAYRRAWHSVAARYTQNPQTAREQ